MILSLDELRQRDFQISAVNILHQKRSLGLKHVNRKVNGFLYILHGNCRYSYRGGAFDLSPGSVVYLPVGSEHTLTLMDEILEFIRIDFTVTVDSEIVLFSDRPLKMRQTASREFAEAVRIMEDKYQFIHDSIGKTMLICTMLQELASSAENYRKERLAPAVRYLLENMTAKVECGKLSESCNLSSSQFYNLFHEEYGMTPLQYRDTLLVRKAETLLSDGGLSVAEIAELLGFETVAYFSRFFKKYRGVPPSRIRKESL